MPNVFHSQRQILLKIVYYGPGLGGKTTNLEFLHAHTRPERRGKLLSLSNESERTLFFDLLPMELGDFRGYSVRLHLCTVPGQIAYDQTRQLVLRNVDGVVMVIDSQPEMLEENRVSLANLSANLSLAGLDPTRVPLVLQYNKQDIPSALSKDRLREELGLPNDVPQLEASAKYGGGVAETLRTVVRECLQLLGDPRRLPEGRSPSILPGHRESMFPDAVPHELMIARPSRQPARAVLQLVDED